MIDYKKLLNEEQLKPVFATEGPVLVLAGAGSGKTRVLTYRIAHLIEMGVSPYSILAITFTNKAAQEMKDRIEGVTGQSNLQISTFHSFCAKVLRQDIEALGEFTKNFTIYDDDTSNQLVKRIIKEKYQDDEDVSKNFVKEVRNHISYAKNFDFTPDKYYSIRLMGTEKGAKIKEIFEEYNKQLVINNALDFDDILIMTLRLFKERPDVLDSYQNRYQYIHVDEFQDTNKIQYLILKLLGMKFQNVFVVGDDDQSIYGWRGADYSNIRRFKNEFLGCQVFKLERNYRSTKAILGIANKVIKNNNLRMGKELWTNGSDGVRVDCIKLNDEREEADYIARQIISLKRYNNYQNKDFAILVRTTSITRSIEDALLLYNIPYKLIGGRKFYERKEVKDFLAYLNFISNPADEESLLRVINVPKRGIGDGAVEKVRQAAKAKSLSLFEGIRRIDELDLPASTYKRVQPFSALVNSMVEKRDIPLDDYIDYVNEVVDFSQMYNKDEDEDITRLENINELISSAKEYYKDNPHSSLSEYLQSVTLLSSDDKEEEGADDLVTIATVHGVKGLEYTCVYIAGCEDGIFPILRSSTIPEEIEEERRIMYVAITRAKEKLTFTYTRERYRFGQKQPSIPSQFLKEAELIRTNISQYSSQELGRDTRKTTIDFSKIAARPTPSFAKTQITPSVNKDVSVFKVGQTIKHARYGEGTIVAISGENGDISFPVLGVKKFNLRLAPIEIVK